MHPTLRHATRPVENGVRAADTQIGISDTRLSRIIRQRLEASDDEKRRLSELLGLPVEHLFGTARSENRANERVGRIARLRAKRGGK
jgi:hypothetical protein